MKRKKRYKAPLLFEKIDAELLQDLHIHNAYEKYCGELTLEDVFTTDSVYLAAKKCASGFMSRPDTRAFMSAPWLNSLKLCQTVLSGKFVPRYYRTRLIRERGKQRVIRPPYFECKVVQKVLCTALLRPVLEHRMVASNYASVRGKGTQKLYADVRKALYGAGKNISDPVIVMTDYRHFFGSIDNEKLEHDVYARYFRDERLVRLIRSFSPEPLGLSLGNECSQVPASFYPSPVDHWVKDRLGVKYYFRYMDDILFIADSSAAPAILQDIQCLSRELGLEIPDEKIRIVPYGQSFQYCKERYIYNGREYYCLINPAIPRRERIKLKAFARKLSKGEMSVKAARDQYRSVRGTIESHPNTATVTRKLDMLCRAALNAAPVQEQETGKMVI